MNSDLDSAHTSNYDFQIYDLITLLLFRTLNLSTFTCAGKSKIYILKPLNASQS
jgi:hypothetical protein